MQLDEGAIPGVILAGGQGRRIGGQKAHVVLAGRPLWKHVADRVALQVTALAVNAPTPMGDHVLIQDATPGLGPLGGVLAAMTWAKSQGARRVLTVAVDTPFLPTDLVAKLREANTPIAISETSDGMHGTTALWAVSLEDDLRGWLTEGGRKVTDWATSYDVTRVRFADTTPPAFFNINTAEDLAKAEAWL